MSHPQMPKSHAVLKSSADWVYLFDLLPELLSSHAIENMAIFGVSCDSREVSERFLFIDEGHKASDQYIQEAIYRGARVVVSGDASLNSNDSVRHAFIKVDREQGPVLRVWVPDFDFFKGRIVHAFYHDPTLQMSVVGITGTNGKTSIASMLAMASAQIAAPCAMLGTRGWGMDINNLEKTGYTTPPLSDVAYYAWKSVRSGAERFVMEVSSHAIAASRVSGVHFDTLVLTNVTRDHFDYHGGFETYRDVKASLFHNTKASHIVLNLDDPTGRKIARDYAGSAKIWGYTVENQSYGCSIDLLRAFDIQFGIEGLCMKVLYQGEELEITSSWIGDFNASNILATMCTLLTFGLPYAKLPGVIAELPSVPGRMEKVSTRNDFGHVIVDYAHTPAALEVVLSCLKQVCQRSLILIFGCGGDRDKGKREEMGAIAEKYANQIILTSDNPRSEDPRKITDDILKGMMTPWDVEVNLDREEAIAEAIHRAHKGDIVLICGKGDEMEQVQAGQTLLFSDREKARYFLSLREEHVE